MRAFVIAVIIGLLTWGGGAVQSAEGETNKTVKVEVSITEPIVKSSSTEKKEEPSDSYAEKRLTAGLFVINSAPECQSLTDQFRSIVGSRLASTGFSVINQDIVLESLEKEGITNQENAYTRLLEEGTALSLAEAMNADYLIVARLLGTNKEQRSYQRGAVATDMNIYKLHVGYEVLVGADGSSFISGAITPQKTELITKDLSINNTDRLLELMGDAANQISSEIGEKLAALRVRNAIPANDNSYKIFTVNCVIADLSMVPLTLPHFWIAENGIIEIPEKQGQNLNIYADGAIVELDGVMVGTTPGTFEARSGVHKLSVTREGNKPVVRTVNIKKSSTTPQVFNIAVAPTSDVIQKLKENILFFQELVERNQKLAIKRRESDNQMEINMMLTEGEVQKMYGFAKFLEQSGFRVEVSSNYTGKSPYDGSVLNLYHLNKDSFYTGGTIIPENSPILP